MGRPEGTPGSRGEHEAQTQVLPERRRTKHINEALSLRGLVPFDYTGNVTNNEIEFQHPEQILELGRGSELSLVKFPALFTADTTDAATGAVIPGEKGTFWTVTPTQRYLLDHQVVIPFVSDVPAHAEEIARTQPRENSVVDRLNTELLDPLGIKRLPFPVGESPDEYLTGNACVVDVNKNRFYVIIYELDGRHGRREVPIVYNAHSATGIDGSVFTAVVRDPNYGGEFPSFLIGKSNRPNNGRMFVDNTGRESALLEDEIPRGFFNPSEELGNIRGLTDTAIPVVQLAVNEFRTESGADGRLQMWSEGKLWSDPLLEANAPTFYGIRIGDPELGASDIEPGEKYYSGLLFPPELFNIIPGINDVFTLTGIAQRLAKVEVLALNDKGKRAQDEGERMVLGTPYIFHRGEYVTSVLRTNPSGISMENYDSVGSLSVNSGMAHILPDIHTGTTSSEVMERIRAERGLPRLRLVYPDTALRELARGQYDIVTAAAVFKALHAKGYLKLDISNLQRL